MRSETSVSFQDHPSDLTHQGQPKNRHQPLPKRRVIILKPLQEETCPPARNILRTGQPKLIAKSDSDITSTSSLSFSPTSVLPQQPEQGVGNLFKALKQQAPKAAPVTTGITLHKATKQQLGSWADNQVVHNLVADGTAVQPLPGASESASSTPIVIRHQAKPQPCKAPPVMIKGNTLEAAWWWKFKRQWGEEQLNYHFPKHHHSDDDDDDDEACNDPWHDALHMIQAANTTSDAGVPICDHDCYAEASPSPLLDSDDLDGLLEHDTSPCVADVAAASAIMRSCSSRALAEAASKARQLRKYQVHHFPV